MIRRKIVLQFITGADEDNNYRYKRKTLKNIRPELTDAQLGEFVQRYCALTAYTLAEAVVVDERVLIIEEEELIEVIPQEEPLEEFLNEEEDISEKGVTSASLQKSEAKLVPKETMTLLTERVQTQVQKSGNDAVATHKKMSPKLDSTATSKHFNPLPKVTPALPNQQPLKTKITIDKFPVIKDKKISEIKKQSPPDFKKCSENDITSSVEKIAGLENEAIEIVLDASQAFSVEALIELVEKSELDLDMIKEKKLPLTKAQPQPTLEIQGQFTHQKEDADLFTISEFSSKKFVRPVMKKKMHPPVGKKTKLSKEK